MLSGIEPPDLMRAIERGDVARLTAIPGVGKKTVRTHRARAEGSAAEGRAGAGRRRRAAEPSALRDDVLSALMNLGYHRPLAEKAVDSAIKATPDGDFEQHIEAGAARARQIVQRLRPALTCD